MPSETAEYPLTFQLCLLPMHLPWYEHLSGIIGLWIGLPIASLYRSLQRRPLKSWRA